MLKRKTRIYIVSFILIAFFCFIFPHEGYAVPAAPFVHTISQPDGTTFKARQWGDENIHGWDTEEGYSILFDEKLGSWTYAVHAPDGSLVSSGMIVGKDIAPSTLKKKLRPKDEALSGIIFKRLSRELKAPQKVEGISPMEEGISPMPELVVPPTGTGYVPTIFINFNDRTTTYTTANFNTLLFGTGNYSMKDYYQEVSYGAFSVSPGPGGVVGWYTASNTHDYYGTDVGGTGDDAWPGDIVYEAVAAADAAGFNFAPYDQDGDCYVDVVNLVHQGTGQEASGISTDIWSHRWSLAGAQYWGDSHYGIYTTNDSCPAGGYIKINDYVIQPEILWGQIQTMGVFAHEYGHALGLPDLYDTDGSSEGIGDWSLMAGGSWNYVSRSGDRPAHMDAWCKYKLGWITPTQVTGTLTSEPITQAATSADVYKLLTGTPNSGEYFLIENRQKTGFDAGLPGAGLLIWHIDAEVSNNNNECYPGGPSCSTSHYKVALEQADNLYDLEKNLDRGDTGDPYPGSTSNTTFNASSSPNSNLYNGSASNVSVTSISASGSTMTATLTVPTVPTLGEAVDNTSLTWTTGGNANWFGQTAVSYYGGDSAQSGLITDNQTSWVETTVTGPGTLTFYWKVSSESDYDFLRFYIDGVEQSGRISGTVDWQQKTYEISSGSHTLKWAYIKDESVNSGSDAGWLDYVTFSSGNGSWTTSTIDSSGNVGEYTSIAIDSNNKIHISYYDGSNYDLKYATNVSGSWATSTIDSTGNIGRYSSIAVDSNNKIHISYYDDTNAYLRYATNASGSWVTSTIDSTSSVGTYTAIAIDSHNKVHIAYYYSTGMALKYATNSSGSWVISTIHSTNYFRSWISMAIDSNNKIHISFYNGTSLYLQYATNASGSWVISTLENTSYAGEYTSIAIDSNNKIHISYYDGSNYDLKYATNVSGSWATSTIDSTGNIGRYSSIAVDSNNKIHISYYDDTNAYLRYATNASGSWVTSTIDSSGAVGLYTSIAINSNNKVHISYYDSTNYDLKYATNADCTPPTGTISINAGAGFTNSTSATLSLTCSDASGCAEMQFSNDNVSYSTAEAYATAKTWTLTSGNGTKTVYAKFKDSAGNWSTAYSDTIVLDTTAPTTTASPAGGLYSSAQSVTLSCNDGSGSGCAITYYCTGSDCTPTTVYSSAINISVSTVLRFYSIDNAGYNETVKAETYTIQYTLSVNKTGTGSGTVTSSPAGIDCGSDCSEAYTSGTVVTLSPTSDTGSTFSGWSGDADCSDGSVTMDADKTCTATFTLNTYTVTPSAGTGGSISPNTPQTVNYNATTSFTVTPNTGYSITSVTGCSGTLTGNTYTTGVITSDCAVSASFAINQYSITATAGANGSLDVTTPSPATVNHGSTTSFKFNADTGYHVANISGCGGTTYINTSNGVSTYSYTTGLITGECAITATFAINIYTLTVNKTGTGSGTVTSSPSGIDCGLDCSEVYTSGTIVTLSPAPDTGSTFTGWSGDADCSDGQVTMDANKTCTAIFNLQTYTITASAGSGGSILPSGTVTVNYGGSQTFTVTPNTGYSISSVTGCGGTLTGNTYTTGAITADCAVIATFAINTYTVTPSAGAGGSISPNTPQTVNYNATTSFTVTPNTGYSITSVTGCGGTLAGNTYTTGSITGDCTVIATFAAEYNLICPDAGTIQCLERIDGGDDSNNLSGGKPKIDLEYQFKTVVKDTTGSAPLSLNLYLTQRTNPQVADFTAYPMTCTGNYATGATCTYETKLGPAAIHKYYFEAKLADGTVIRYPETGYITGAEVQLLNGYTIVGAPRDLSSVSLDGTSAFNSATTYRWIPWSLTNANTGKYELVSTSKPVKTGEGYFVMRETNAKLLELGTLNDITAATFTITLSPGWNLISNPYGGNVRLKDISVQKGSGTPVNWMTAATNNWVVNSIYYYKGSDWGMTYSFESAEGSPDATLTPWMGYWIYLRKFDDTYSLTIPKP